MTWQRPTAEYQMSRAGGQRRVRQSSIVRIDHDQPPRSPRRRRTDSLQHRPFIHHTVSVEATALTQNHAYTLICQRECTLNPDSLADPRATIARPPPVARPSEGPVPLGLIISETDTSSRKALLYSYRTACRRTQRNTAATFVCCRDTLRQTPLPFSTRHVHREAIAAF